MTKQKGCGRGPGVGLWTHVAAGPEVRSGGTKGDMGSHNNQMRTKHFSLGGMNILFSFSVWVYFCFPPNYKIDPNWLYQHFFSHLKNILHFKAKRTEKTSHTIGPKLEWMAYSLENVSDEGPFSCVFLYFQTHIPLWKKYFPPWSWFRLNKGFKAM